MLCSSSVSGPAAGSPPAPCSVLCSSLSSSVGGSAAGSPPAPCSVLCPSLSSSVGGSAAGSLPALCSVCHGASQSPPPQYKPLGNAGPVQRLSRLARRCKSAHLVLVAESRSRKLLGAESKMPSVRWAPSGSRAPQWWYSTSMGVGYPSGGDWYWVRYVGRVPSSGRAPSACRAPKRWKAPSFQLHPICEKSWMRHSMAVFFFLDAEKGCHCCSQWSPHHMRALIVAPSSEGAPAHHCPVPE